MYLHFVLPAGVQPFSFRNRILKSDSVKVSSMTVHNYHAIFWLKGMANILR